MSTSIAGIKIPDSALARATTDYIRDIESDLLYHHSRRVFLFGALSGERKQLTYNPELLYVGAMTSAWSKAIAATTSVSKSTVPTRRRTSSSRMG